MQSALVQLLHSERLRGCLVVAGILASLIAVPLALYGGVMSASNFASAEDLPTLGKLFCWSFGGLIGIVAAWARVLLSSPKFDASPTLAHSVTVGLAVGVLAGGWMLIDAVAEPLHFVLWYLVPVLVVGVFLLGGHVAERRNAL